MCARICVYIIFVVKPVSSSETRDRYIRSSGRTNKWDNLTSRREMRVRNGSSRIEGKGEMQAARARARVKLAPERKMRERDAATDAGQRGNERRVAWFASTNRVRASVVRCERLEGGERSRPAVRARRCSHGCCVRRHITTA